MLRWQAQVLQHVRSAAQANSRLRQGGALVFSAPKAISRTVWDHMSAHLVRSVALREVLVALLPLFAKFVPLDHSLISWEHTRANFVLSAGLSEHKVLTSLNPVSIALLGDMLM